MFWLSIKPLSSAIVAVLAMIALAISVTFGLYQSAHQQVPDSTADFIIKLFWFGVGLSVLLFFLLFAVEIRKQKIGSQVGGFIIEGNRFLIEVCNLNEWDDDTLKSKEKEVEAWEGRIADFFDKYDSRLTSFFSNFGGAEQREFIRWRGDNWKSYNDLANRINHRLTKLGQLMLIIGVQ